MVKSSAKQIAIRVDASTEIGTGHVMRCLTLADALRQKGATSIFLCRPHQGHLLDVIAERGHEVVALPELSGDWRCEVTIPPHAAWLGTSWQRDAEDTLAELAGRKFDWLVMDHYALDARWQAAVKSAVCNLMVIDDLADRPHICDLLLDQNLGRKPEDYAKHLVPNAKTLIGPRYALLRSEFAELRQDSLARRKHPRLERIMVSLGGVDKENMTSEVLDVLNDASLPDEVKIEVVMGSKSPWIDRVHARASRMAYPTNVLVNVSDMAGLMAKSDFAVGAAGTTSWERCCLGLPSVVVIMAENQISVAEGLSQAGAAIAVPTISKFADLAPVIFSESITKQMSELSINSSSICDGGGTELVVEVLSNSDTFIQVLN